MSRIAPWVVALGFVLGSAPRVRADVPPDPPLVETPELKACSGKAKGDKCAVDGAEGVCNWGSCPVTGGGTAGCIMCLVVADAGGRDAGASDAGSTASSSSNGNGGCTLVEARAGSWLLAAVPLIVLALVERRRSRR